MFMMIRIYAYDDMIVHDDNVLCEMTTWTMYYDLWDDNDDDA